MKKTIYLWMAAGVLWVSGAFFIPEQAGSIWPALLWGSAAAVVYLVVLLVYWLPKIESTSKRRGLGWTLGILLFFSGISAAISYEGTQRQVELLPEIRTTIEKGIAETRIQEPLLKTLRDYHRQEEGARRSIGNLFRAKYDSLINNDSLFTYGPVDPDGMQHIYVSHLDKDSVVLVAESSYIDGRNAEFENFSGSSGQFQMRGILTKKGVRYEQAN